MDSTKTAIDITKDVGPTMWKYIKFQIRPNFYAGECRKQKKRLESRYDGVQTHLRSQETDGTGKVAMKEVELWLEEAKKAIEAADEDQCTKCGCFCNVCRSRHFFERAQELKAIFDEGEKYTHPDVILVQDDHSKLKDHFMVKFEEVCESLKVRLVDIQSKLNEQLCPEKLERDEVKHWREQVRKKLETAQVEISKGGCHSDDSLLAELQKNIRDLEKLHGEGKQFIGAELVNDNFLVIKEQRLSKLEEAKRSLRLRKEVIESTLKKQLCYGKVEKVEVVDWRKKVEKLIQTAEEEISKGVVCLSPARLVPLLKDKIGKLNQLFVTGGRYTNDDESLVTDDPEMTRGVPLEAETCYGRDTTLAEILKYLKGDKVTRIAVWGMGGVGKTTIMQQIHNLFLKDTKFEKVVWVTVSSKFDVLKIQNVIAKELTKEPLQEEDATKRKGMISAMLRRGNYLLILDDVWENFFAEEVGIPNDKANSGDKCFKVVLTTRTKVVARRMVCNCKPIIELKPLSHKEALTLFLDKVGGVVLSDNREIKPNLEFIVKQIVEKCGGLPLAIVTLAGTMKGMSESDHQDSWETALEQLQNGRDFIRGAKDPKAILKFSYDSLDDKKIQDCFLHCALYPEDHLIEKQELIEYWIQEGFLDQKKTRHKMFSEGHWILRKLQDNCLLECIKYEAEECQLLGYETFEERVKMHDLLREMALDIMSQSPQFFVKEGVSREGLGEEEELAANDVQKISFMWNGMKEIPLAMVNFKYYKLTTLLMSHNQVVTIPESLFVQMSGLKILDLSWNESLSSLPDSTSNLLNLTTLLLEGCKSLKNVPSLSQCQALTMLNLSDSGVEEVPDGMKMLVNLEHLCFKGTEIEKLPKVILPKLLNLQYVSLDEVDTEEVVKLERVEYVEGIVGSLDKLNMMVRYLHKHNQAKQFSHTFKKTLPLLAYFLIGYDEGKAIVQLPDGKPVCSLEISVEEESLDLRCLSSILTNDALSLQGLASVGSDKIECIIGHGFNPLQTLTNLYISYLDNLRSVFDEEILGLSAPPPGSVSFSPLKSIYIAGCPRLKKLFSPALLIGYLQNLEFISIKNCDGLEEIISSTSEEEAPRKLTLPS